MVLSHLLSSISPGRRVLVQPANPLLSLQRRPSDLNERHAMQHPAENILVLHPMYDDEKPKSTSSLVVFSLVATPYIARLFLSLPPRQPASRSSLNEPFPTQIINQRHRGMAAECAPLLNRCFF